MAPAARHGQWPPSSTNETHWNPVTVQMVMKVEVISVVMKEFEKMCWRKVVVRVFDRMSQG